MSTFDTYTVVYLRREKTALEAQAEAEAAPEKTNRKDFDRWVYMGETIMGAVPAEGETTFVNGTLWVIHNRTWSIPLAEKPGQPSPDGPQVMLTLGSTSQRSWGPDKDFFE